MGIALQGQPSHTQSCAMWQMASKHSEGFGVPSFCPPEFGKVYIKSVQLGSNQVTTVDLCKNYCDYLYHNRGGSWTKVEYFVRAK